MVDLLQISEEHPTLKKYVRQVQSALKTAGASLTDIGSGPTVFTIKPRLAKRIEYLLTKFGMDPYSAMARVKGKDRFTIICDVKQPEMLDDEKMEKIKQGVQQILSRMGYRGVDVKAELMSDGREAALVITH